MMSLGCAGLRCRALLLAVLSLSAVTLTLRVAAQSSDSVRTALLLPGLEGRPFVVWEIQPLTGARRAMKEGAVGLDGRMALSWPADGALRFFRVDCAGSTWTVPVAEAWPAGTRLVPAPPGRAPFARRPGTLQLGNGQGDRTVERLAAFESAMEEVESDAAVEWQRQWLMGDAARGGETEALGDRIGESENSGDAMPMETIGVGRRLDSLQSVAALGAAESVVDYIEALRWRTTLDLPGTDMDAARLEWQSLVAPDVSSQSASLRFAEGALRFATEETWPDTLVQRHKKALDQGDFDALVSTTANWWGGADAAKTEVAVDAVCPGWVWRADAVGALCRSEVACGFEPVAGDPGTTRSNGHGTPIVAVRMAQQRRHPINAAVLRPTRGVGSDRGCRGVGSGVVVVGGCGSPIDHRAGAGARTDDPGTP